MKETTGFVLGCLPNQNRGGETAAAKTQHFSEKSRQGGLLMVFLRIFAFPAAFHGHLFPFNGKRIVEQFCPCTTLGPQVFPNEL